MSTTTQILRFPSQPDFTIDADETEVRFVCRGLIMWRVTITPDYPHLDSDKLTIQKSGIDLPPERLPRLWKTLYWYFQLPSPSPDLIPGKKGSPQGKWKVHIDTTTGIFADPSNVEKAAAAGLLSYSSSSPTASAECYVLRSSFWQIPPQAYWGENVCWGVERCPKPVEWRITNGTRHPVRPRPVNVDGVGVYKRFIPSLGQFLSFRLANAEEDAETLHRWMNDPRVAEFWGEDGGGVEKTRAFLEKGLASEHCYPIIGCWDGEPFGYFEVYWVKEDGLGKFVMNCDGWDRGVHCLVGEQRFRGPHRVGVWISSLVHYMFLDDPRTQTVMLEPRVDNVKFIKYLTEAGFYKEKEFAFPHKQAALVKLRREAWDGPLS